MTKVSAITILLTNLGDFSGFYTGWLLPAAVVGVLVFLYGVATMDMNQIALEVCNEGTSYEVTPFFKRVFNGPTQPLFRLISVNFQSHNTIFTTM